MYMIDPVKDRKILLHKYRSARLDVLIVFIFSIFNGAFHVIISDGYMEFSAMLPYRIFGFLRVISGKPYSDEYAREIMMRFSFITIILAVLFVAFLVTSFAMSRKDYHWLTAALVFFCIGAFTVLVYVVAYLDVIPMIANIAYHAIAIYQLLKGIKCGKLLRRFDELSEAGYITAK